MINCPEIENYLQIIEHNDPEYPVCRSTTQFAAYIRRIFDTEDIRIDREQLAAYLDLQKYFPFDLFPWETCLFALHNCVYTPDGALRWPILFVYVGRGAGKNGYLSFEDFALLTPINRVKKYGIDIYANSEDQARTTFDDVYDILQTHERKLRRFFTWNRVAITNIKTGSTLRYRTSNSKTKDGGRPGKNDFDEVHAMEGYDLITTARTGEGKVAHPRETWISTDGFVRDGPLDHYLDRARQILTGSIPDNGLLPYLCHLDSKSEVDDERNWHKANPSLRYNPTLMRQLRLEYADFQVNGIGNVGFMVKRMNVPMRAADQEVTEWANILACSRPAEQEPTLWTVGIDFAKTTDFVGVNLMGVVGDTWVWKPHTFVCSECPDLHRIKFPVQDAAQKGHITIVDDVEISPTIIADYIGSLMDEYHIVCAALDDYRYAILKKALSGLGFTSGKEGNLKLIRPSDIMRISPIIISQFAKQNIAFGDDPVMRWSINNAKKIVDGKGNITFGKVEPKSRKTDTFMAAVASATLLDDLETAQAQYTDEPMDVLVF